METQFIVWFNNGTTIKKTSLEEALKISHFNYIIKAIPLKKCNRGFIMNQYEFFDENGNSTKIRVNNFELIDIIEYDFNSFNKELVFYDTKRDVFFKKRVNGIINHVFSNYIIDFLNKVNELGSFEVLNIIEENEALKKEVQTIRKLLNEKEALIKEMKKQN